MSPTTKELVQIATEHNMFIPEVKSYLEEYDKYVAECAADDETPISLEEFMFEGEQTAEDNRQTQIIWGR